MYRLHRVTHTSHHFAIYDHPSNRICNRSYRLLRLLENGIYSRVPRVLHRKIHIYHANNNNIIIIIFFNILKVYISANLYHEIHYKQKKKFIQKEN